MLDFLKHGQRSLFSSTDLLRWSISMESVGVGQVASTQVVSVGETDKIKSIAELFERHCVGAAPVVDGLGKCIGCISSRDLVRFDLHRWAMNEAYAHGIAFDFKHHKTVLHRSKLAVQWMKWLITCRPNFNRSMGKPRY